ncbi:unnamed protein product [Paramecium pentaurelia]|uniref:Uncharacterized protein n=1 Tax=Paramecium pentaurelia TaxID=43138 RepID=A0A8S1VTD5_9CILI|nr:unnamed protein product [Paramecium pentaurelia]
MEKLKLYIESNQDQEFKGYMECEKIISKNMKENFRELCLRIQQFLDNDKSRYICQFCIIKLCYKLTIDIKYNEEFLFEHFQNIVLPSIINYIYNNQMYSKQLEPKVQQYILSSVTMCKELVSYFAHVYPQTKDYQPSKFLCQYQIYKKQQKENQFQIEKKKNYQYLKKNFINIDQNYKQIKQQWKSQNLVQDVVFMSDNESNSTEVQSAEIFQQVNLNSQKKDQFIQSIEKQQQNIPEEIEKEKKDQLQQILDNLQKQIDQKKLELQNITQEVLKKQKEHQQLQNQIVSQIKSISTTDGNQSNICKISNISIHEKQIFDPNFNFECDKQYIIQSDEPIPLVQIDKSYPDKKKRLLDGRGLFQISEYYLLARQLKFNQNTLDMAIYLKCIQNSIRQLKVQIKCEVSNEVYSNLNENNNLKPEQQVRFEIRNIQKSQLYQKDIKIELIIESDEIILEETTFYLKLTNIVEYTIANEQELVKEYQSIPKILTSKPFKFDDETFPNGLFDVQKCIQCSLNYKDQGRSLFFSGSIYDQQFICRITLDEEKQAQVNIKQLQQDEELCKRLVLSYIEALNKI